MKSYGGRVSKPKAKFSPEEDLILVRAVQETPNREWRKIAEYLHGKSPRQCRERYQNYLDPRLQEKPWSVNEDAYILHFYSTNGPHWNFMARTLTGRSGNAVRNRFMQLQRMKEKAASIQKKPIIHEVPQVYSPPPKAQNLQPVMPQINFVRYRDMLAEPHEPILEEGFDVTFGLDDIFHEIDRTTNDWII